MKEFRGIEIFSMNVPNGCLFSLGLKDIDLTLHTDCS